jgi:hypothetical protein
MFHSASSTIATIEMIVAWRHWGISRVNRVRRAEQAAELTSAVWRKSGALEFVLRDTKKYLATRETSCDLV